MPADAAAAKDAESPASFPPPQREPWFPLLAAVTPSLYAENPFRVLGLTALATPREVARRFDELKLSLDLAAPAFTWAFAPHPPPDSERLRDAAQVLKDAPRRMLHEFFWLWPADYPEAGPDPALAAWFAGDAEKAFGQWNEAVRKDHGIAAHNLAVSYLMAALDREQVGAPLDDETLAWWRRAQEHWFQLRSDEDFWQRLHCRVERLADARVPADLAEQIRSSLPDALSGLHAALAIERAHRAQWHEASMHVQFARQVQDVHARAERAIEGAVGQVVRGIDLLVRETTRQLAHDGSAGLTLTAGLLADAADELEAVEAICGHDSDFYRAVSTRVVDAALEGIIGYQRRTLDSCGVLPWLTHLTTLPASPEVRRRLEETADVLHANAIAEKLAPVEAGGQVAAGSVAEFEAAYRLLVEEFIPGAGRIDFGARAHADYLANVRRALRELAHAACHQLENLELATRALAAALEISEGAEREALAAERGDLVVQLARRQAAQALLAETATAVARAPLWERAADSLATEESAVSAPEAADAPMSAFRLIVAEHRLEIAPEAIVFDGVTLRVADLTGLRYGVRDAAAGDGVVRTYQIGWCTAEEVVELDAGNLLAPYAETEQRYSLVLEALYTHVVPGLIERLVEWVRRGEAVPLGDAVLRQDGFVFSGRDFHWPSGEAVPYSQLAHALDAGEFIVARTAEPTEVEHHVLVDVWNAAIGGHVIDALAAGENPGEDLP